MSVFPGWIAWVDAGGSWLCAIVTRGCDGSFQRKRPQQEQGGQALRVRKRYIFLATFVASVFSMAALLCRLAMQTRMWEWLFADSPASPIFEKLLEPSHAAADCRRRPPLAGGWWFYCGPQNGKDFSQAPRDILDTICAQHDYCIEKSHYHVRGEQRLLYPMGQVDADNYTRCGIPVRSHTNPHFGCQISACDREMLQSLEEGFRCSENPLLPKSAWCHDANVRGRLHCEEYKWTWRYTPCRMSAAAARAYHRWKLSNSCRRMKGPAVCVCRRACARVCVCVCVCVCMCVCVCVLVY